VTERACNWPECSNVVATFMCAAHWQLLSSDMQKRVRAAWQPADPDAHSNRVLMFDVERWLDATFGAKPERDTRGRWARLVRYVRDRDAARGRAAAVDQVPATRPPVQLRLVP
jgi:hypothetical protein